MCCVTVFFVGRVLKETQEADAAAVETQSGPEKAEDLDVPEMSEMDRKAFVRQRWITAINKVRDEINQVRTSFSSFYRACKEQSCDRMSSVRLSVRPSVT